MINYEKEYNNLCICYRELQEKTETIKVELQRLKDKQELKNN